MSVRCARDRVRGVRRRVGIGLGTVALATGSLLLTATGQSAQAAEPALPAPLQVLAPTGGQAVNNTGRNIALIVAGILVLAVIIFLIILLRRRKDEDEVAPVPPVAPVVLDASGAVAPAEPESPAEPGTPQEPKA